MADGFVHLLHPPQGTFSNIWRRFWLFQLGKMLLASSGQKPGIFLNIVKCTGQHPPTPSTTKELFKMTMELTLSYSTLNNSGVFWFLRLLHLPNNRYTLGACNMSADPASNECCLQVVTFGAQACALCPGYITEKRWLCVS